MASPLERPSFWNQFMMGVVHMASTRARRMGDRMSLLACMPNMTMNMAARVTTDMTSGGIDFWVFTITLLSVLGFWSRSSYLL
jgi:hypothetical protein